MALKKAKTPETEIKDAILRYCKDAGIFAHRRNVGAAKMTGGYWVRFNKAGMADIWGIHKGRHWECEIKRPGEEPDQQQTNWLIQCADAGAFAFWVDSLDDFIKAMEKIR